MKKSFESKKAFKSGFAAIIGRPNVGKSTLLNALVGERIAITTPKPQTTRNRITGICNLEGPRPGQIVLVDTPGIHRPSSPLNRAMVDAARSSFRTADVVLFIVEAGSAPHRGDLTIIEGLGELTIPVFLLINKMDRVDKALLSPLADSYGKLYPFRRTMTLSALKGAGVEELLAALWEEMPEGPAYFPADILTDRSERFIAAEIIREKIMMCTRQEVPYSTAVVIDSFKEDETARLLRISATINVAKDSQKGILIGRGGQMLRQIGTQARLEMERFFAARVFLELFVRVAKDWPEDPRLLREFGYVEKER